MKRSMWSSYFNSLSPEDMVAALAGRGWRYAELSDEHAEGLLGRGPAEQTGQAFARLANDSGLSFLQGHLWLRCDIAGPDRLATVDRLKAWLDLFLAVGIKAAVLHPAGYSRYKNGDDPRALAADSASSLAVLSYYPRVTDLTICLENLFTHSTTCADLISLIEAAGARHLGICLATGHLNLAGRDQDAFIRQAGGQLKALHITDNQETSDQHLMPFGPGTVDWPGVVRSLMAIGYDGLFNYEIPGERHAPLPILLAKLDYIRTMTDLLFAEAAKP